MILLHGVLAGLLPVCGMSVLHDSNEHHHVVYKLQLVKHDSMYSSCCSTSKNVASNWEGKLQM